MTVQNSLTRRLWQEVCIFTVALLCFFSALLWPITDQGNFFFVTSVLAATSGLLLAMSFSLSSFAYYFDFLDTKLIYRKYLGLMGYFVALAYAAVTASHFPERYLYSFPQNLDTPEVGLGVAAMGILTLMAFISNQGAIRLLGGKLWKDILGLGYIAYALLVMRGLLLDAALWNDFFNGNPAMFSVRMALTMLGTAVLLFRVSVPFHQKYAKIQ